MDSNLKSTDEHSEDDDASSLPLGKFRFRDPNDPSDLGMDEEMDKSVSPVSPDAQKRSCTDSETPKDLKVYKYNSNRDPDHKSDDDDGTGM